MSDLIGATPLGMLDHDDLGYYELQRRPALTRSRPWEFNGWKAESLSWKQGCYIHTGLSGSGRAVFKGPHAQEFLESLCINSFAKFPIGTLKYGVMCNKGGLIAAHGIIQRQSADEFHFFAGGNWPVLMAQRSHYSIKPEMLDYYLFQVAGPTSLQAYWKVTGSVDPADICARFRTPVEVGWGRMAKFDFRDVLSMGCIDLGAASIGTEALVQWGNYGRRIKPIRATVERLPYLQEGRNSDIDVQRTVPNRV